MVNANLDASVNTFLEFIFSLMAKYVADNIIIRHDKIYGSPKAQAKAPKWQFLCDSL